MIKLSTYRIVTLYLIFAGLWIAFSDQVVNLLITQKDLLTFIQSVKGFAFVIVTGLLLYLLVSRYVQELKRAHQQERVQLEKWDALLRCSPNGIVAVGKDGTVIFANAQAERWLKIAPGQHPHFCDHFASPEKDQICHSIGELFQISKPEFVFVNYGSLLINGERRWFELRMSLGQYQKTDFIIVLMIDITEKLSRERIIELLQSSFETVGIGIALAYGNGEVFYVNNAMCSILGKSRDEIRRYTDCVYMQSSGEQLPDVQSVVEEGNLWQHVFETKDKDLRQHFYEECMYPLTHQSNRYILITLRDVTKQVQAERRLIQQQRLEAIGYLANGIAHDFNNILAVILGNIDLLLQTYGHDESLVRELENLRRAVLRGRDMTSQILSFSKERTQERTPLDISKLIHEVVELLQPKIGKKIKIITDCPPSLPKVLASQTGIYQVLLNLCINACQAMQSGGTLHIKANLIETDDALLARHPELSPGHYIRVDVSDTGTGIQPEVMEHIFEPFFTTKNGKNGSGLGLYVVRTIVTSLGGGVSVYSDVGRGTRFCVYLPVYTSVEELKETGGYVPTKYELPTGSERILLVDDEPLLTGIMERLLEKLGYHVRVINNPHIAKELVERGELANYDLAIIDNIMPEITGEDIINLIHERGYRLPIILTSGMVTDELIELGNRLRVNAIFEKPMPFATLGSAIRKVIDEYKVHHN